MSPTRVCLLHSLGYAGLFSDESHDIPLVDKSQKYRQSHSIKHHNFKTLEGKLARWPKLSSSHISFQNVPTQFLTYHLPGAAAHFPFDFSTVTLICQAEK